MNDQHELEPDQTVYATVAELMARRGWALLPVEELGARVREVLAAGTCPAPGAAVLFCYARVLYTACVGGEGRERQELAFRELFRYVYDNSRRFAADLSADERHELANQTIAEIYYRLTGSSGLAHTWSVREPGAFFAVATQQLRNVLRRWRRAFLAEVEGPSEAYAAPAAQQPEQVALADELSEQVRNCFQLVLRRHPRARGQLLVVWLRHMVGEEYQTIADRYDMAIPNLRTQYARGIDKLRHDPDWNRLGHDLGLRKAVELGAPARTADPVQMKG